MADVTFGVKVSEEMKIELSELMKNTELSGKEFMGMLLSSYKLESNKKERPFYAEEVGELQRLIQRIQAIYLNLGEKTEFIIEERLKEVESEVQKKVEELEALKEKVLELEKEKNEQERLVLESKKEVEQAMHKEEMLTEELKETKGQLKNNQLLYHKYENEIETLEKRIEGFKRLELEIEERNEENQKLKTRNDELASDLWFLQREIDKMKEENKQTIDKLHMDQLKLKETYELEIKNQLLEQKLAFNAKLELLKEDNFKIQQEYAKKMQTYLENSLNLKQKQE